MRGLVIGKKFHDAVNEVRQNLIEAGLKVVAEIPTSEILAKAGYNIPFTHQIMFFRPDLMNLLLQNDQDLIMQVPLKIVIRENSKGEIELIGDNPEEKLSGAYPSPIKLHDLIRTLDRVEGVLNFV